MIINRSEGTLFYTNQMAASLIFAFGLIAIDRYILGECKKQIALLICLTTVFALYNLITQIEYPVDSFVFYDNYSTMSYIINGLEIAVLAFYGILGCIKYFSVRNLRGSFGVFIGK